MIWKTLLVVAAFALLAPSAFAQATSRPCPETGPESDQPGPACLLAHVDIGDLPAGDIYWHVTEFADLAAARAAAKPTEVVVDSFGKAFVFSIGPRTPDAAGTVQVGPLPLDDRNGHFVAEYLKSTFTPGMTAPVHVHSGPEAFYVVSGDSCLESPDGVQTAKGAGSSLIIRQGPPMLLMAVGSETRRGFALILHRPDAPPTTMVQDWTPKGLCHAG